MSSSARARTARIAWAGRFWTAVSLLVALTALNASLASAAALPARQAGEPALAGPLVPAVPGQISGTVTAAASKDALSGIEVCAYSKLSELGGELGEHCATTDAAGEYTVAGLPAAEYTIEFYSLAGEYATQYYDGRSSFLEATKVPVSEGAVVPGVDAAMAGAGRIAGKVTAAEGGAPLEDVKVCVYENGGEFIVQCTSTGAGGEYTISRLPQAEYTVDFYSLSGAYATQYWNDEPSFATANRVAVSERGAATGIDAAMAPAGEITGTVSEAGSAAPLENIKVCAYGSGGEVAVQCTSTTANGRYTISRLAAGRYTVGFFAVSGEYVTQYFNDKALFSEANRVGVRAHEATSGIDAAMTTGGQITGTVTSNVVGEESPIEDVRVCAHEIGGEATVTCASTNASGEYTISRLPAAEYVVAFEVLNGAYLTQYYNDRASFSEASKLTLAKGGVLSGVDAAMQPLQDAAPPANLAEAPPKIAGEAEVGAILTCAKGSWTGNPEPIFSYQWLRDGAPIAGASSRFYSVQAVDQSRALVCEVTARNFKGAVSAASAPLEVPAETPVNIEPPRVFGTPSVGSILACEPGSWTGNPKPTFAYQWLRAGEAIAGATSSTYVVQAADRGQELTCEVTGTNPAGVARALSGAASIPPSQSSSAPSAGAGVPAGAASVGVQGFVAAQSAAVGVTGAIRIVAGAVFVPLRCLAASGSCPTVTIRLTVKTSKRTLLVAKLSVTLKPGQGKTVKVTLDSAGRKLFATRRRFTARLLVEAEGASIKTQSVTLARAAKKH
jgi:carboxypeptidase family protein